MITAQPGAEIVDCKAYLINLDRSNDRLESAMASIGPSGLECVRIRAVDGRSVDRSAWKSTASLMFWLKTGRDILPGEYGCYRSHITALKAIASAPEAFGLVLEDDVQLPPDFGRLLKSILATTRSNCVIKLFSKRRGGFVHLTGDPQGAGIGTCLFGPQGSAAAYLVPRPIASELVRRLEVMSMPFDHALERPWQTGIPVFTTSQDLVGLSEEMESRSTLLNGSHYSDVKFPKPLRMPSYLFKAVESTRRVLNAARLSISFRSFHFKMKSGIDAECQTTIKS